MAHQRGWPSIRVAQKTFRTSNESLPIFVAKTTSVEAALLLGITVAERLILIEIG